MRTKWNQKYDSAQRVHWPKQGLQWCRRTDVQFIHGPYFIRQLSSVTSHRHSAARVRGQQSGLRLTTGSCGHNTCDEHAITRQAMYKRNTEERSHNHCCREKAISIIIYSECVCSLSYPECTAHALCYIVICGLSCLTTIFHIIS
jgi:hypothetical protein